MPNPEHDPAGQAAELSRLEACINAAAAWLYQHQAEDGYWVGMLESNCGMEAEWLLAMHILGYEHPRQHALVQTLLNAQRQDGAWEIYYAAPDGDINITVECYAALRASGLAADTPALSTARDWILAHGGFDTIRVFTRYWLALIGEWPWDKTPCLPPEVIALPGWFPLNIYRFACWARATLVPLSILSARRLCRPLPPERRLNELFPLGRQRAYAELPRKAGLFSWPAFFLAADTALRTYQKLGFTPGREAAIRQCVEWIIKHQDADGAWGGIQPPWIYSLMALYAEGYPLNHPVLAAGLAALDTHWSYERDGGLHIQGCESPVWDTLLSSLALIDCGYQLRQSEPMQTALNWLLARQVTVGGDWQHTLPKVTPGGWAFERANTAYPDVDDTALALIVLAHLRKQCPDDGRFSAPIARAVDWILAMQSSNGGWAAFDRDNTTQLLTAIPFCDFGEVLDPPSVDVTAHVVEAFGLLGYDASQPAIARALAYIRAEQEPEGSWFGRWGVNHIYGTAAVLPALRAIGEDMSTAAVQRAGQWLAAHQNADGGWGETCASYMDDRLRGTGPSTASQTAWALMALTSLDGRDFETAIRRGTDYLVRTQRSGSWDEPYYTGTGFPGYVTGERTELQVQEVKKRFAQGTELQRGFMINYNLYRHYFPLMALGRVREYFSRAASRPDG